MQHCKECEAYSEYQRCSTCGMTGKEIAKARRKSKAQKQAEQLAANDPDGNYGWTS